MIIGLIRSLIMATEIGEDGFPTDYTEEEKAEYRRDFPGELPKRSQDDAKQRFKEAKASRGGGYKKQSKTSAKAAAIARKKAITEAERQFKPVKQWAGGLRHPAASMVRNTQLSKTPFSFLMDSHGSGLYGGVGNGVSSSMGSSLNMIGVHGIWQGIGVGDGLNLGIGVGRKKTKR
jgi:hypothetical protein